MLIFIWKATKHDVFECVCRWWSGLVLQSLAEKWELAEALQTPLNSIAREMIFWKRRRFSSLMGLIFKTWNCMLCQKKIGEKCLKRDAVTGPISRPSRWLFLDVTFLGKKWWWCVETINDCRSGNTQTLTNCHPPMNTMKQKVDEKCDANWQINE